MGLDLSTHEFVCYAFFGKERSLRTIMSVPAITFITLNKHTKAKRVPMTRFSITEGRPLFPNSQNQAKFKLTNGIIGIPQP